MGSPTQTLALVASAPVDNLLQWKMETLALQDLAENELLIKVVSSGICHTDLTASVFPVELGGIYPKVLGHEGAGYVEKIGSKVTAAKLGNPVLLSFASCKSCRNCNTGHPAYCENFLLVNYVGRSDAYKMADGVKVGGGFFGQSSFSKFAIVTESSVVNLDGTIQNVDELKLFAPLGCGLQTGAASLLKRAMATASDTVAVIGLGGVGMAAIMAAKIIGCSTIIGIDIIASRLELAKELGATIVINSSDRTMDLGAEVKRLSDGVGPSVTIDTTGIISIATAALDFTASLGRLVIVGVPSQTAELQLNLGQLMASGKVVMSSTEGDATPGEFIPQMIQWHREGKFPIERLVKYFDANDFQSALEQMKNGTVIKPVLIW